MPKIIPISDLKNTTKISELCDEVREPIFITKNGKGNLALMNMAVYEGIIEKMELYKALAEGQNDILNGRVHDVDEVFNEILGCGEEVANG